jgi:predicted nucleic acid-binding protein
VGVILDTSVLIEWERKAGSLEAYAAGHPEEPVGFSVITAAELLHGVHRADASVRRLKRSAYVETDPLLVPAIRLRSWHGACLRGAMGDAGAERHQSFRPRLVHRGHGRVEGRYGPHPRSTRFRKDSRIVDRVPIALGPVVCHCPSDCFQWRALSRSSNRQASRIRRSSSRRALREAR